MKIVSAPTIPTLARVTGIGCRFSLVLNALAFPCCNGTNSGISNGLHLYYHTFCCSTYFIGLGKCYPNTRRSLSNSSGVMVLNSQPLWQFQKCCPVLIVTLSWFLDSPIETVPLKGYVFVWLAVVFKFFLNWLNLLCVSCFCPVCKRWENLSGLLSNYIQQRGYLDPPIFCSVLWLRSSWSTLIWTFSISLQLACRRSPTLAEAAENILISCWQVFEQ